jgi:hypothetical protein
MKITVCSVVMMLGALVSSCVDSGPVVGSGGSNHCTRNEDCREGVCEVARRRCVSNQRTEVFFVVSPHAEQSRDLIASFMPLRAVSTGEALDLTLRQRRTLYGSVLAPVADSPTELRPVMSSVFFTPSDNPDDAALATVVSQEGTYPALNNDTMAYTWTASLPSGRYDVLVRPSQSLQAVFPPRFERDVDVRPDSPFQRFDMHYPLMYARWSGVVRNRSGEPVSGLTVRAVDPEHNNIEVSTTVRTRELTSETPGAFSLAMAPGAPASWNLRITSSVNAHAGFVMELSRQTCARLDNTGTNIEINLPTDLGLPVPAVRAVDQRCTGCVRVTASVEGLTNGMRRTLRGASVTLRMPIMPTSSLPDARAWFEDRVQTDADGTFTTWLIPGAYEVLVTPQGETFANAIRRDFRVRDDAQTQSGQVFRLDPRIPVEGRVLTMNRESLRGARVQAVPFADAYQTYPCNEGLVPIALSRVANPVDTVTTADGSYRLDLDPGVYRLAVEPPPGSGFATTLSQVLCISSRTRALDIVMDSPVEVHGTVRNPSGSASPGSTVEAVLRVREAGARGVLVRVGRVQADGLGAYSIALPADSTAMP